LGRTDGRFPTDQGFDEWFGFLNQRRAHHHFIDYIWRNKEKYEIAPEDRFKPEKYTHTLFTEFALDFIDSNANKDKPFFLYIPYLLPHAEYEIPEINKAYQNKDWAEEAKVYASMVTLIDSDVGKIMTLLKKLDITDNTVVFFTSDNGAALRWDGVFDSSGKLKGHKRDVYEGGIRVPMIVSMPGTIPKGVKNTTPWYFPDVFPTLADFAGAQLPQDLDGISLKKVIVEDELGDQERLLYWEFHEEGGKQGIRKGKWKLVRLDVDEMGFHSDVELYDIAVDLGETNNLADQYPELVKEMIALMDAEHVYSETFPFTQEKKVN
jgi:arylsulfatase A-like enzyme